MVFPELPQLDAVAAHHLEAGPVAPFGGQEPRGQDERVHRVELAIGGDEALGADALDGFGDEGDAFATEESFKPSYWFSYEGLRTIDAVENVDRRGVPQWLTLDKKNFRGTVAALPEREDITMPIEEHLIIELYSK